MHELSICASIAGIVTRRADGRAVETVHVTVGQLRQVVPDTLAYCWTLVVEGTGLDGARLELQTVDAVVDCPECGRQKIGDLPVLLCPACERADVTVVAGEEFEVTALELVPS